MSASGRVALIIQVVDVCISALISSFLAFLGVDPYSNLTARISPTLDSVYNSSLSALPTNAPSQVHAILSNAHAMGDLLPSFLIILGLSETVALPITLYIMWQNNN